jgi:DNA-binding CsgD family transcriptional regulator
VTLSIEPLAPDPEERTTTLQIAVVASATFHRDVLAFVLGQDPAFDVGPSVGSLDELDSPANSQTDIAVVVLPDGTGVAVLPRSSERSWHEQLSSDEPTVIIGWNTPPVELRRMLKRTLSRRSRHNRARAVNGRPDDAMRALTERELEVLVALAEGRSAVDTATVLGISPNTVRTHVTNLLRKLGAHSRLEAVAMTRDHLTAERQRRGGPVSDDIR